MTVLTRRVSLVPGGGHQLVPRVDANALVLGSATATLVDVVVRTPGEHRIEGRQPHAEIQLRFRADAGAKVALAIPVVRSRHADAVDTLGDRVLDLHSLLPRPREIAAYHGTETVPPFVEPTMWLVALTPLTCRTAQLADIVKAVPRPLPPRRTQPADGRPVVRLRAKVLTLRTGRDDSMELDLSRT